MGVEGEVVAVAVAGPAVSGPRVLSVLRERTRALHAQVEAGVDMQAAMASIAGYRRLLEGYLGLYRPFERALAEASDAVRELVDWPRRSRVKLLERDLRVLGGSDEVADAEGLPELGDGSAMLGALYVIEGSQLGGQYIFREIQSKLGLHEGNGAAFFFGAGASTGGEWKRFLAGLEEQVSDVDAAADAAVGMFGYFERGLSKSSNEQEKV